MWAKIKNGARLVKAHAKNILLVILSILASIFFIFWFSNKKKVNKLQAEIHIQKAKVELEKLAAKNQVTLNELRELEVQDTVLRGQIREIEDTLAQSLDVSMTAEEIVEAFKRIGKLP